MRKRKGQPQKAVGEQSEEEMEVPEDETVEETPPTPVTLVKSETMSKYLIVKHLCMLLLNLLTLQVLCIFAMYMTLL